jgi:hypothetical protein
MKMRNLRFRKGSKMIEMDSNHYQVLKDSLTGQRAVDEQTLGAIEVLGERLEELRKFDKVFAKVSFSPAVRKLAGRSHAVAIG